MAYHERRGCDLPAHLAKTQFLEARWVEARRVVWTTAGDRTTGSCASASAGLMSYVFARSLISRRAPSTSRGVFPADHFLDRGNLVETRVRQQQSLTIDTHTRQHQSLIVTPVSCSDTSQSFRARRGSVAGSLGARGSRVSLAKYISRPARLPPLSAVAASHTCALAAGPSGWSRSDRGSCSPTTTAEPERPACDHMH